MKIRKVKDFELMGNVYIMLFKLERDGYFKSVFKNSCSDRREISFLEKIGIFEIYSSECRERVPFNDCPFCEFDKVNMEPYNKLRLLEWKNKYYIIANAQPYVPNHILFLPIEHKTQDYIFENNTYMDIIKFYLCMRKSGTLFFNHFAGNSVQHFHVHHTTRDNFPIVNIIKDNENVIETSLKNLYLFDDEKCTSGLFIVGINNNIFQFIVKIIKEKNMFLNLLITNIPEYGIVTIIFVRRNEKSITSSFAKAGFILNNAIEECTKTYLNKKEIINLFLHHENFKKFIS